MGGCCSERREKWLWLECDLDILLVIGVTGLEMLASRGLGFVFVILAILPLFDCCPSTKYVQVAFSKQHLGLGAIRVLKSH